MLNTDSSLLESATMMSAEEAPASSRTASSRLEDRPAIAHRNDAGTCLAIYLVRSFPVKPVAPYTTRSYARLLAAEAPFMLVKMRCIVSRPNIAPALAVAGNLHQKVRMAHGGKERVWIQVYLGEPTDQCVRIKASKCGCRFRILARRRCTAAAVVNRPTVPAVFIQHFTDMSCAARPGTAPAPTTA